MKKRFLLPAMAFVFAIGLSFATESSTADAENDYLHLGGDDWIQIPEVDCGDGNKLCQVIYEGQPQIVFDSDMLGTEKEGDGNLRVIPSN